MKRKAFKQQRKRIQALADKWISPIGLSWWSFTLHYHRSRRSYKKATGHDARKSAATCCTDWRYQAAEVHFNCPLWAYLADGEAERALVHELMHAVLAELPLQGGDGQDHLERVCTALASAFVWGANENASTHRV